MQNTLLTLWGGMQRYLFPALEAECGPLTDIDQRFVQVLAVLGERFGTLVAPYGYGGVGRPPDARAPLARAFIAKSVYRFCTTAALIEALRARTTLRRLCGWDSAGAGPGEWTFSRAFGEFAGGELPQALHAALIADHVRPRLVGHISRDSTAVERVNGHLKDNYGGRWIRVRGASKGMCHLMFAVVALTAERLLHLVL